MPRSIGNGGGAPKNVCASPVAMRIVDWSVPMGTLAENVNVWVTVPAASWKRTCLPPTRFSPGAGICSITYCAPGAASDPG